MTVKEFRELLFDTKIEIDNFNYEKLYQGNYWSKNLDIYDNFEIINITINEGYILIRINKK